MTTIAIDAMGGDHAPRAEVEGAILAAREFGVHILLVGIESTLKQELSRHRSRNLPIEIVAATDVITMSDSPSQAFRRKKESSMHVAAQADTMRRLTEGSGEGAKAAIQLMREEERLKRIKTLEGLKIGGIINVAVGVALLIFLRVLLGGGAGSPFLCGLIPGFIGIAMLAYAMFLAAPVE